jgi:hypothetical protein
MIHSISDARCEAQIWQIQILHYSLLVLEQIQYIVPARSAALYYFLVPWPNSHPFTTVKAPLVLSYNALNAAEIHFWAAYITEHKPALNAGRP